LVQQGVGIAEVGGFGILQYYLIEEKCKYGFGEELSWEKKKAQMVFFGPKIKRVNYWAEYGISHRGGQIQW